VQEEIDLSDYLGEEILVRFQFASDGAQRADGFYFDDLKINIVEEVVLNTNDVSENAFIVYPNPVTNVLNISSEFDGYQIDLYTLQGQLIQSSISEDRKTQVDYSFLASGLYLLKLTSDNASKTLRIVKQ